MGRPALTRRLDVRINGRLAGDYRYSPSGGTAFAYDPEWLDWEHAFPISRQLPLTGGSQTGAHVSAVFENLLPDNSALRRLIAERTEARSARPHDLLAAIGRDCIGAMQFLPPGAEPGDPFSVEGEPQDAAAIADTIRTLATSPLGMEQDEAFRISLAGAQEKIIRRFLNLNEVRHFKDFTDFTVVFPKTFLTEEGLSHDVSHLSFHIEEQLPSGPGTVPFSKQGVRIHAWPPPVR